MTGQALTEEEIRPAALMARQRIAALTDIGRMLSKYEHFVEVDCPACGSADWKTKYQKNGMNYVDCQQCETFFINPRPPANVLGWFYQDSPNYAYWNEFVFPASEAVRREKIFVPRVDQVLALCGKYGIEPKALLEVGAGFGTFCSELNSRGVFERVVAVEPTRSLAETCRNRGLEVIELPVEQIDLEQSGLFDVVANFEVIEHLFSPADFVRDMARMLRPGGLMVITCPNGKGFDVETLGTISDTVDHEHLNYFNPASLSGLLAKCGLETLESFTPGKLDADLVRNKVMSGEFDVSTQPFLKKVLIDEWDDLGASFQDFITHNGLSSNMWLVARKV